MSWNIEPYNWYPRFIGSGLIPLGRGRGFGVGFGDILREYDEMQREMKRYLDIGDIEKNAPRTDKGIHNRRWCKGKRSITYYIRIFNDSWP